MNFIDYLLLIESTGTAGAAAAGQWADIPISGTEFYRKMGNQSRPKTVAWDDFSVPKLKSKLDPRKMYGMEKKVESFEDWYLNENTISQSIKEIPKVIYDSIKSLINDLNYRMHQVNSDRLEWLKKWMIYNVWLNIITKFPNLKDNINNLSSFTSLNYHITDFVNMLKRNISHYLDYIVNILNSRPDVAKSKFNNLNYSAQDLEKDSDEWHEQLKLQDRRSADPGRRVPIAGMPSGYYWVSLDKGYCDKEGTAMGHCGNQGAQEGDVIYSMRDSKGIPHLTFIANDQKLGESKGFGNEKPEKKYHPQIVAFLLGQDNGEPIVEFIRGGGYQPKNNFHFEDLDKSQQERVLAVKPYIDDWGKYLVYKNNGNPVDIKKYIEKEIGEKIHSIDGDMVIVKEFDYITELIKWLQEETHSELKEIPDLDDPQSFETDYLPDIKDAINEFDYYANDKNKELANKILEKLKASHEGYEDEDFDIEWAAENNDEFADALRFTANDGYRMGAEADAHQHLIDHFNKEEGENGFWSYKRPNNYWVVAIKINDLGRLIEENGPNFGHITDHIKFTYSAPYNGYSGFEKEGYNEYLSEKLEDVLDSLGGKE